MTKQDAKFGVHKLSPSMVPRRKLEPDKLTGTNSKTWRENYLPSVSDHKADNLHIESANINKNVVVNLEANILTSKEVDSKNVIAENINHTDQAKNLLIYLKTKNLKKGDIYEVNGRPLGLVVDTDKIVIGGMVNLKDLNLTLEPNMEYYYDSLNKCLTLAYSDYKIGYSTNDGKIIVMIY